MGNIAIYQDGRKAYLKSVGYADMEVRQPNNSETLFRIGPVSRVFTATLILQKIEDGKLNPETKLADFFPRLPGASKITVQNLLHQDSDLPDFTQIKDSTANSPSYRSKEEVLKILRNENETVRKKVEPPNPSSPTDYVLLSYILEEMENKDFSDILTRHILSPLQMKRSRYAGKISPKNNEAFPYMPAGLGWAISPETNLHQLRGAGGIITTVKELAQFYTGLFSDKLMSNRSLNTLKAKTTGVGVGFKQLAFHDKTDYFISGTLDGFHTMVVYFPKEKTTLAITLNASKVVLQDLAKDVLEIYFGYGLKLPAKE